MECINIERGYITPDAGGRRGTLLHILNIDRQKPPARQNTYQPSESINRLASRNRFAKVLKMFTAICTMEGITVNGEVILGKRTLVWLACRQRIRVHACLVEAVQHCTDQLRQDADT